MSLDPLASKYPSVSPYAYALNNPLKFLDPDGRDIGLAIDRDRAFGYGHMMVVVGSGDKWTIVSFERKDGSGSIFGTKGEVSLTEYTGTPEQLVNENNPGIKGGYNIDQLTLVPTSAEQDAAALDKANQMKNAPPRYEISQQNCADVACVVAESGGVQFKKSTENNPAGATNPNATFDRNRSQGKSLSSRRYVTEKERRAAEAEDALRLKD